MEGAVTIPSVNLFLQEAELMYNCDSEHVLKVSGLGLIPESSLAPKALFSGTSKKQVRASSGLTDLDVDTSAYERMTAYEIVCEAKANGEGERSFEAVAHILMITCFKVHIVMAILCAYL